MAAVLRRLRRVRVAAGLAATAVASIALAACSSAAGGGLGPQASLQSSYEATITRALPSVVEISAGGTTGSGVVFDNRGDVVTNAHVVGKHTRFDVRSSVVSQTMKARLVGVFTPDDLAVIKVGKGSNQLRPVRWANSDRAQVGQIVLAMGSPYGLTDSVTQGIVSATGRTVTGPDISGHPPTVLVSALQTSAAINPGNSGGALVLLTGEVLGIPTLTATDPELGGRVEGIGFAIPANTAVSVARQLINQGKVTESDRASLNIAGETHVNAEHVPDGVAVTQAHPGGAAAAAGIRTGDVIAGVAGRPAPDIATLDSLLVDFRPGQRVKVELLRGGNPRQVMVRLGSLTSPPVPRRGRPAPRKPNPATPRATSKPSRPAGQHHRSPHP
ncbi:MAG: S1C family serine protease [Streptosporangiaceae bacterium]